MHPLFSHGPARDAVIALARDRSAAEELQCHALLGLLETGDAVRRAFRQELASHAHTESGFAVLACLAGDPAGSIATRELVHRVGLSPHAIEIVLGRLEMSGLIAREAASCDRPCPLVSLTEAGRAAFASAASHCLAAIRRGMSTLDPSDVNALDRTCTLLRQFSTQVEPHTS